MEMLEAAKILCRHIQHAGYQCVLTGGFVRDYLQNKPYHDIDIATDAPYNKIPQILYCIATKEVGSSFGIILVRFEGYEFEIAQFRTDIGGDGRHPDKVQFCSMEEDAQRRDFTMNAVFYDPVKEIYYDYVDGIYDIRNNTLKFVGNVEDRIKEDYLRILRYIRFYNQGYKIVENEKTIVNSMAVDILKYVSPERISMEFVNKIIPNTNDLFSIFNEFPNVLKVLFPEIEALKDVWQSKKWHPEGDVYIHTSMVVKYLCERKASPLLIIAGMFHDVGKPATTLFTDGDWHAYKHHEVGADITEQVLKNYKFSNDDIKYVKELVYSHMKLHYEGLKKSTLKKIIAQGFIDDLVLLTEADCMSSDKDLTVLDKYKVIINELKNQPKLPVPFITGKDLIDLGLKPGPKFKELLTDCFDKQLEDNFLDKENALEYLKQIITR
jgi:poly(A) polymerase